MGRSLGGRQLGGRGFGGRPRTPEVEFDLTLGDADKLVIKLKGDPDLRVIRSGVGGGNSMYVERRSDGAVVGSLTKQDNGKVAVETNLRPGELQSGG